MEDVGQDQQTALQHPCRVVCSRDITLEPSKGDQIISASNQQPDQPTTSPNSSKEKALSIVASSPSAKFLPFFIVVIGIDLAVALGIESWCFEIVVAPLALIPHSSSPSPTTLTCQPRDLERFGAHPPLTLATQSAQDAVALSTTLTLPSALPMLCLRFGVSRLCLASTLR